MDYEKAYKDAIARAKAKMEDAKVFDYDDEQTAHTIRLTTTDIFPELKESEDERIRKNIVEAVELHKNFTQERKEHIYAWLEKQSKASKVEEAMRELEEKVKAFTEAHKSETSEEILAQMKGEQKAIECDESIIDETISLINKLASGYGEKVDEPITFNGVKMINNIKERLRTIKPQPQKEQWKPSEKQIEAVRIAAEIGTANDSWAMGILKSMYRELKHMMEE